jgi:glyceraldehyde-3-phosphate dehydrogenase/erythrose-4-phosphate dehydrogenase
MERIAQTDCGFIPNFNQSTTTMVVEIKKPVTKKKIKKALAITAKNKTKKTLRTHFGKLKRGIDGLAYQKSIRNEWD